MGLETQDLHLGQNLLLVRRCREPCALSILGSGMGCKNREKGKANQGLDGRISCLKDPPPSDMAAG